MLKLCIVQPKLEYVNIPENTHPHKQTIHTSIRPRVHPSSRSCTKFKKVFLLKLARFSVGLVVQRLADHAMLLAVTLSFFVYFLLFSSLVILVCFFEISP